MKKINKYYTPFVLIIIFFISILIRSKHLGQDFGSRHDWLSAHTLATFNAWDKHGFFSTHLSPIYTQENPGDKHDYSMCALVDEKGNAYYVSYGPFGLIFPYIVFKLFFIPNSEMALGIFGLIIHFFICLYIYKIVLKLENKLFSEFSFAGFAGFVLYNFSPGALWYHSNVYFNEVLAQLLFVVTLFYFIRLLLSSSERFKKKDLLIYALLTFLSVYNEWLGLFLGFTAGLAFLFLAFHNKKFLIPFFISALACSIGLLVILFQYSSIQGFNAFIEVSKAKFSIRNSSDFTSDIGNGLLGFEQVNKYIIDCFFPVLWFLAAVLVVFFSYSVYARKIPITKIQCIVLLTVFFAVLIHVLLFFNFTHDHEFSSLKLGLFSTILTSILLSSLFNPLLKYRFIYSYAIVLLVGLMVAIHFSINAYYSQSIFPENGHANKNIGLEIQKYANPNEKVFTNYFISPHLVYYSHRNLSNYVSGGTNEVFKAFIKVSDIIYFHVVNDKVVYCTRFFMSGDSLHINIPKQ